MRLLGLARQQPKVRRGAISLKVGLVVAEVVAGCEGRAGMALLARLSWPSPKPVTPRHLETITRNNEGNKGPGGSEGSGPRLFKKAKELGPCSHLPPPPPPPLFALALARTAPTGPSCQEKSAPEPQTWGPVARLGAQKPGQKSGDPSQLGSLLSEQDSCIAQLKL